MDRVIEQQSFDKSKLNDLCMEYKVNHFYKLKRKYIFLAKYRKGSFFLEFIKLPIQMIKYHNIRSIFIFRTVCHRTFW